MKTKEFLTRLRELSDPVWGISEEGNIRSSNGDGLCPIMEVGRSMGHPTKHSDMMKGLRIMAHRLGMRMSLAYRIAKAADGEPTWLPSHKRRSLRQKIMRWRLCRACGLQGVR